MYDNVSDFIADVLMLLSNLVLSNIMMYLGVYADTVPLIHDLQA